MSGERFLVTLVHGTWAKRARWTKEASTFRRTLELGLKARGAGEVRFTTFAWTGDNTHDARRRASVQLALHIRQVRAEHPGARHFVVAHSHGGNVVLRTLRIPGRARSSVEGVACLATPFLRFERAQLGMALVPATMSKLQDWLFHALGFALAGLGLLFAFRAGMAIVFVVLLVAGYFLSEPVAHWTATTCAALFSKANCTQIWNWLNGLGAGLGGLVILAFLVAAYRSSVRNAFREQRRRLARARRRIVHRYGYFQPRFPQSARLLIHSSSIDEALGALSGSWWLHRTSGLLVRLFVLASILLAGLAGASLIAVFLYLVERYGVPVLLRDTLGDILVLPVLVVLMVLLSLLVAAFSTLGSALVGRLGPGLTFDDPQANLMWLVRASRQPPPGHAFEHRRFSAWSLLRSSGLTLFHSRLHSSRPAVDAIAEWMCGGRGGHSAHSPG